MNNETSDVINRLVNQARTEPVNSVEEKNQKPDAESPSSPGFFNGQKTNGTNEPVSVFNTIKDIGSGAIGGILDAGESIVDLKDIFNEEAPDTRTLPEIKTETKWGEAANTISQMAVGLVGAGKFIKVAQWAGRGFKALEGVQTLTKGGMVAKGLASGAIADFTVFDENEGRLADLLTEIPGLKNPVFDYLATQEDDTKAEGRLKNTIEGMALGGAIDIIIGSARLLKLSKSGNKEKAIEEIEKISQKLEGNPEAKVSIERKPDVVEEATPNVTPDITPKEAEQLIKDVPDDIFDSYKTFALSNVDDKLKNVVSDHASGMADEVLDIMTRGETDVAMAFNKALSSNKKYSEFTKGLKDSRLYTVMTEAVRDKVIGAKTFTDVKTQARALTDAGLMDDEMFSMLSLDSSVVSTLAPRLLLYRMESIAKSHVFSNLVERRLMGDVAGTESIEQAAKEFTEHIALTQSVISGLGRGLGSLRLAPTDTSIKKAIAKDMKRYIPNEEPVKAPGKRVKEGENNFKDKLLRDLSTKDYLGAEKRRMALNNLIKSGLDFGNVEHLRALDGLMNSPDDKFIRLFAKAGDDSSIGKTLMTIYVNNLLSSPATHIFNTIGGTLKLALSPAARIAGGVLTTNLDEVKHGVYQYAAYASVFMDSVKAMAQAFRAGGGVLDVTHTFDKINKTRIAEDYQMRRAKKDIEKGVNPVDAYNNVPEHLKKLSSAVGWLGATGQLPLRVMGAADEFFKQMAYRSEVYAKAAAEASEKGIGDKAAYITEAIKKSLEDGYVMDRNALTYATEMTWQQNLKDQGLIGNAAYHLSKMKALKPFAPFIQTPTNLLKDIIEHSPFAYGLKDVKEAFAAGGERRAMAEGKIAIGQALCFSGMVLAANGTITGSYPKDPVTKQVWADMGRMPYSFKVGDKYIPYNRLDPFGAFFGITADLYTYSLDDGKEGNNIAAGLLSVVVNNIMNKTYVSGLSDAIEMLSDPTGNKASYIIGNFATGMIPFSGAIRFGTRTLDSETKEVRTFVDKLTAMTPVLSENQPSRHSWITGKTSETSYLYSDGNEDAVLEELLTSAEAVRGGTPSKILQGIKLSAEQYSELCRLQGSMKIGGRTLYDSLENLFASPGYKNADELPDYDGNSDKSKMVTKVIQMYKKAAIDSLKASDPSIDRQIRILRQKPSNQTPISKYSIRSL